MGAAEVAALVLWGLGAMVTHDLYDLVTPPRRLAWPRATKAIAAVLWPLLATSVLVVRVGRRLFP